MPDSTQPIDTVLLDENLNTSSTTRRSGPSTRGPAGGRADLKSVEHLEQWKARVPGHVRRLVAKVIACKAGDRDELEAVGCVVERRENTHEPTLDFVVARLSIGHRRVVHFVDNDNQLPDTKQGGDKRVTRKARLEATGRRIDDKENRVDALVSGRAPEVVFRDSKSLFDFSKVPAGYFFFFIPGNSKQNALSRIFTTSLQFVGSGTSPMHLHLHL